MVSEYSSFLSPEQQAREPAKFNKLKEDEKFVEYLARNVSHITSATDKPEAVSKIILKLSGNDATFALKVTDKLTLFKGSLDDKTISRVQGLIRSTGILKPSDFYGQVRIKQTTTPTETLSKKAIPVELQARLGLMLLYLNGDLSAKLSQQDWEVLQVLQGKAKPSDLPITKDSSETYLTCVKLWDHAASIQTNRNNHFPVSSYALRTHIAEKGNLASVRAFTKTLDPKEYESWTFLEKQSNWVPERAQVHAKIIELNLIKALALSRRLDTEIPSVWAVRGNTGAGKTYCIGKDPEFVKALDENGSPSGAINPDTFKGLLKQETPRLTHNQLHKEGSALSFQYAQALGKEAVHATMIIDMRLAKCSQVDEEVIDRASIRQGEAMLMDIETPVITSINRVLTRTSNGNDPVVPLSVIKQGYEEVRAERAELLQKVKANDTIKYYTLYITDENGLQKLAAEKKEGRFIIAPGMEERVNAASAKPAADEVDKIVDQVIDDSYIEQAKTRDHISSSNIHMIERWKGYTVRQALERHALGVGP